MGRFYSWRGERALEKANEQARLNEEKRAADATHACIMQQFWRDTYVAAIRAGKTSYEATSLANGAIFHHASTFKTEGES